MSMSVISFVQQKGGCGKTTLAFHTAAELSASGARVVVVDADIQRSLAQWCDLREARGHARLFELVEYTTGPLHHDVEAIGKGADYVLIDAPGVAAAITPAAIAAADLCVIPVRPAPFDVWAAAPVLDKINEARRLCPEIAAAFVVNCRARTRIGKKATAALAEMATPCLRNAIGLRTAFVDCVAEGMTVAEYEPGGAAAAEIAAVTAEIVKMINLNIANMRML